MRTYRRLHLWIGLWCMVFILFEAVEELIGESVGDAYHIAIGHTPLEWLAGLSAIGIIVLTVTGIVLSFHTLRELENRTKKRLQSAAEAERAGHKPWRLN